MLNADMVFEDFREDEEIAEAESLFPEDMDELTMDEDELEDDEPGGYVPGIAFDKDFIRDGQHRIMSAAGVDAWRQWCINCVAAERYSSPIFSTDFGIASNEAFATDDRNESESILIREITEALEADPLGRTEYVSDIEFEWGQDSLAANIEVVGIDAATIDIEVPITS